MPKKVLIHIFALLMISISAAGQSGSSVFSFLALPYSARHNALGGENVSLGQDGDLSMALNNPALLSATTHMQLMLDYGYYGAAMNFAGASYGHNWGDNYTSYSVHYLDYGKMKEADAYGNLTGRTFSARDVLICATYARQLGPLFRVGASLKPVYSNYETYHSFALGADVGGYFSTADSALQVGLSLQNIGWQLVGFYSREDGQQLERMPMNLQLGLSYKLEHAPLRFSLTAHNLQRWNLNYNDEVSKKITWYDMLFRHTVWALDIVPKKNNFWLTLSYNHRRMAELRLSDQKSLAGFALGAGIHVKAYRVGVAFSQYTKSNYTLQATFALDVNQLR